MASSACRPITRLLVANRGEIARRIMRTAHDMGIGTVAVYADGDAGEPFVAEADQAVALRGTSSAQTYLDADKVLDAARRSGADAIHPGYGFLSENADFARAVVDAGLLWVGPGPEAISSMGDKLSAKRLMTGAGVPTLPTGEIAGGEDVAAAAEEIGYPLLVKASAGGGGKGMRVVESPVALEAAVAGARHEAGAAFGDDTLFLERWLSPARHVEIQILGDLEGNVVHCFERECSIQRRHQKIIEEAPSPAVDDDLREKIGDAAVAAGRAIGYASAGTVEFLVAGDEFFFLEVNTRLQVEHPITEEITGLDLVREQLLIAQGESLSFAQDDLRIDGHAIEARVYAEDPDNDFLPATGRLAAWVPSLSTTARFDSGVETGSEVGIEFDPMLAKVIVHARTRTEAAGRLARVLETTRIQGLTTNRDFLVATLRSPEFLAGDTTTDFIDRVQPPRHREPGIEEVREAALQVVFAAQADRRSANSIMPGIRSGWRNSLMPAQEVAYRHGSTEVKVEYRSRRDGAFWAAVDGIEHEVEVLERSGEDVTLAIDGLRSSASVVVEGDRRLVHGLRGAVDLVELPRFPVQEAEAVAGGLLAPMPAKVVSTFVEVGDTVEVGQLLLILEAMKMEHRVTAPDPGVVAELRVTEGDQVTNGELLVVLSDESVN